MAFKIAGRFIALSQVVTVPSTDPNKQPMKKRELYMDCTRYDSITNEMIGKENKVLLEFGGDKVLDKFEQMNLQKGDIINVDFDIQGNQYTDKNTGKMRVFTAIRCFDFNILRRAGEAPKAQQSAPSFDAGPKMETPPIVSPTPVSQMCPPPHDPESPAFDPNVGGIKDDGLPF